MIKHRRDLWQVLKEPGNAAEIGVAEGLFSEDMLKWPVQFEKVYLVDRWRCVTTQKGDGGHPQEWHDSNLAAVRDRVEPFEGRAVILQGDSVVMARHVPDKSLALVYIDGDHSYPAVMADLHFWLPKVVPGGVVAVHDYLAPQYGVNQAVTEFCAKHKFDVLILPEDKQDDAGAYFYTNLC